MFLIETQVSDTGPLWPLVCNSSLFFYTEWRECR